LASEFIIDPNDGSFCYSMMLDQSSFNFGGGETVTADIHDIIDTASDPIISFVITSSSVTSELEGVSIYNRPTSRISLT
jgi:hypothetical protein